MRKLEKIIANNVTFDFGGYPYGANLKDIFMAEVGNYNGFSIESIQHWVFGLPSVLAFPFYNSDIIKILNQGGLAAAKDTKNHNSLINQYWHSLAELIYRVMSNGMEFNPLDESQFTRLNNDIYGNPRYGLHYLAIADNYSQALFLAKAIGGKQYNAKAFGGGIVFQSYSISDDLKNLTESILTFKNWV